MAGMPSGGPLGIDCLWLNIQAHLRMWLPIIPVGRLRTTFIGARCVFKDQIIGGKGWRDLAHTS
jgi:hypothetical protein